MKNIDRPFLEKFSTDCIYFNSSHEFYQSILFEIKNILETRLKFFQNYHNKEENPFSYGTQDLQSINFHPEGLQNFKKHCQKTILKHEPRLNNLEITKISIDNKTQTIALKISCYVQNNKFNSEIKLKK